MLFQLSSHKLQAKSKKSQALSVAEGTFRYAVDLRGASLRGCDLSVAGKLGRASANKHRRAMRKAIAALYPAVALEQPMTQQAQFDKSYEQQRMFAALGGFFGMLAALLVATGLYGTHSFRVNRRKKEIGIRMALGASRTRVLVMVMRESLWVLGLGLAVGIPLTLFAMRSLGSMLYQVSPFDPLAFGFAIAVLILVSACAALAPARRAASVEPMRALRME